MIAARKFISDLLFIKYLVLRWEINIRKGERDRTGKGKQQERRDERHQGCWRDLCPKGGCAQYLPLFWGRIKGFVQGGDAHSGVPQVLPNTLPHAHPASLAATGTQPLVGFTSG